jgi:menaquinone-specific isochorismate synthase
VQINKIFLLNKFDLFLDTISSRSNSKDKISSFAFEIPQISISSLISSNLVSNKDYFYWKMENENVEFFALQPMINFNEFGENRLSKTSESVNSIDNNFISNWDELKIEGAPLVVGGIKFAPNQKSDLWSDFSDSDWFIPKVLFLNQGSRYFLIHNFIFSENKQNNTEEFIQFLDLLEFVSESNEITYPNIILENPISSNSIEKWTSIVNKALSDISDGLLSKVVLSREVKFEIPQKPFISQLVQKLSVKYPKCYTFAYCRNNSVFIGASPEKLAKIANNWIEVDALAGSAPRGKDEFEDIEMENYLLNSEKNLFEQRAVVNFIHNLLRKFSDEIIFNDKPIIRKLPNIQHLWTVMKAKLNSDFKVFDLLMKIHPTPAICGDPWKVAKDFILKNEPHDRGFYSGNIGWFNFESEGEFAVGIRSAIIKNNEIYVYAGCGIVEGSEPAAEFEESEIKLKPILSLFIDEKIYQP